MHSVQTGRLLIPLVVVGMAILTACAASQPSTTGSGSPRASNVATPIHATASAAPVSDAALSPACALLPTSTFEQVFAETPAHITPENNGSSGSQCTYFASTVNGPEDGQVTISVVCGATALGDAMAVEGAANTVPQVGPDAYENLDSHDQPVGFDFVSNSEEIQVDNDSAGSTAAQPAFGAEGRMITALTIAVRNAARVKLCK